jgi:hypothetical protein
VSESSVWWVFAAESLQHNRHPKDIAHTAIHIERAMQ